MIALTEAPADAPEVLFLGEAPHNSYVEGALSTAFRLTKLHSGQPLAGSEPDRRLGEHALVVLTDYPARNLHAAHQETIAAAVERGGCGLLMIGGWASFGGPRGSYYGSVHAPRDFPMLLDLYAAGKLNLDDMITRTYPLERVNDAYADMIAGELARGMTA